MRFLSVKFRNYCHDIVEMEFAVKQIIAFRYRKADNALWLEDLMDDLIREVETSVYCFCRPWNLLQLRDVFAAEIYGIEKHEIPVPLQV